MTDYRRERQAGEEEDWKKKRDRGGWKRLSVEAVKKLRACTLPVLPTPDKGKRGSSVVQDPGKYRGLNLLSQLLKLL